MIKLAICDIDMMARKSIRLLCEAYFESKNLEYEIKQYSAGEDLLVEGYPDILLLDVRLKRISGILVKEILEKTNADTRILFVSENRNHMADAFGKGVYGYLVKPVKEALFCQKMDEMVSDIRAQSQCVFCKKGYEFYKVRFKDILYIEVSGRGTSIFVKSNDLELQQYATDITLARWEELLPEEQFAKANKRQIVNLLYVVDIKSEIELVNQIKIPIGVICKEKFGERYDEFKSRRKIIYRNAPRAGRDSGKIY